MLNKQSGKKKKPTGPGSYQGVSERIQIGGMQARALTASVGFMEEEGLCGWPVIGSSSSSFPVLLPLAPLAWLTPIGVHIICQGCYSPRMVYFI